MGTKARLGRHHLPQLAGDARVYPVPHRIDRLEPTADVAHFADAGAVTRKKAHPDNHGTST